jgi:hypothetical protein
MVGLGVGGLALGLAYFLVIKPASSTEGTGENTSKKGGPPKKEPEKDDSLPPGPDPVVVLPKVRGKDPLDPSPALKEAIAETDAMDPGWHLAELEAKRPRIENAQNGARQAEWAASLLDKKWEPDHQRSISGNAELSPAVPFAENQVAFTEAELTKASRALRQARKLSQFPRGRFGITYHPDFISTLMPHATAAVRLRYLLQGDAMVRAHRGDAEGCLESTRAILHLAAYMKEEPISLSQVVRMAFVNLAIPSLERSLAVKKGPAEKTLQAMQQLVEEEGDYPVLTKIYRSERAGFHFALTNTENGDTNLKGIMRGPFLPDAHAWYLRFMNQVIAASQLPPEEAGARFSQLAGEVGRTPQLVKGIIPAVEKLNKSAIYTQARLRAAALGLAAERYRLKHGRWPKRLEDLVPEQIKALPVDPYKGLPYKLATRPEGLTIYCLPGNAPDGKGDFNNLNRTPPTNQGFRIVDVSRRR